MSILLSTHGVYHHYKNDLILDNVDFSVKRGEICSILGTSGSGKTTFLRLLAGLEELQKGCIKLDGKVIACPLNNIFLLPEKRNVGMMFQSPALFPHLSIEKNIFFGLKKDQIENKKWALEMASYLGIEKHLKKYPAELSGGQQQRAALLRALAPKPKILLLDEAFSALDRKLRERIRKDVKCIVKDEEISLVMVTHDYDDATFMSDRIMTLVEGKFKNET